MVLGNRDNPGIIEFCFRYVRKAWATKVSIAVVAKVKVI